MTHEAEEKLTVAGSFCSRLCARTKFTKETSARLCNKNWFQGNDTSANVGTSSCVGANVRASKNNATSAVSENAFVAARREKAKEISPVSCWTLSRYCREFGGMMVVGPFIAIAVDSTVLVVYDQDGFQQSTALGARKQHWAVPRKLFAGIVIDVRFADMPSIRCKQ